MRTALLFSSLVLANMLALGGCASTPSKDLGGITPCSGAPHCVSSQSASDSARYVEPFRYDGSAEAAMEVLLTILRKQDYATIKTEVMPAIHATFRSAIGFVDDVTFVVDDAQRTIDVKSTSRLGFYDLGVNRRRVESLRTEFTAAMAKPDSSVQ